MLDILSLNYNHYLNIYGDLEDIMNLLKKSKIGVNYQHLLGDTDEFL